MKNGDSDQDRSVLLVGAVIGFLLIGIITGVYALVINLTR